MLGFLSALLPNTRAAQADAAPDAVGPAPVDVTIAGQPAFTVQDGLHHDQGLPAPDAPSLQAWLDALPVTAQEEAAGSFALAWLAHLRDALGSEYRVETRGEAVLLSSLAPNVARSTLEFVSTTRRRILRVLDGVAARPSQRHDILVVFDDWDAYYRYVARHYPEGGEHAGTGGMYLHGPCGHFVTVKAEARLIEPVIAHELTHRCVAHLGIPAWLNEGLAVNTEQRLAPLQVPPLYTPREMHERHCAYWTEASIQGFWSGHAFLSPDAGQELSYDLARILVSAFSDDWDAFRRFALAATFDDGGQTAALDHLGTDLGAAVAAIFERDASMGWAPDPQAWPQTPERGAFRRTTR